VGIESLHVAGMLQNRRLARALSDAALAEFHRQLRYKLAWSGGKPVEAGRFFPSSKLCSACGQLLDALPLDVRRWTCPGCGTEHDRDVNAAVNLRNLAVSSTVTAYCPGSAGRSENSGETPGL
jgi:putative transposase